MTSEGEPTESTRTPARRAGLVLLALYLALGLSQAIRSPSWEWDVLAYVGCALEPSTPDSAELSAASYAAVREAVTPETFDDLREGIPYRRAVADDPELFRQQLGFYRGRVLYVGLLRALGALGAPLASAAIWLSAAAALAAGVLTYLWLARRVHGLLAALATALLVNASGLLGVAALATPDALAAALVLAGLHVAVERERPLAAGLVFGLAILARADALFVAAAVLAALALARSAGPRLTAARAAGAIVALGVLAWLVQLLSSAPPLSVTLRHTFLGYLAEPDGAAGVGLGEWAAYLARSAPQLAEPRLAALLLLTLVAVLVARGGGLIRRRHAALAAALAAAALARYALFPALWERLLVPHVLGVGIAVVVCVTVRPTSAPRGG